MAVKPLGRDPFARFETLLERGSKASQKAQKRTFCHTETVWHCGTDRAFEGQLVVVPSAPELLRAAARSDGIRWASERPKKNAKSSRQLGKKHPSPHFNSMAVKDGRLLEGQLDRGRFARFETSIEQGSKASQKAQKTEKAPSPRFNSMAMKDGRASRFRSPFNGRRRIPFATL